jgi:hypothetical protein
MSETVDECEKGGSDGLTAFPPTEARRERVLGGIRRDRAERSIRTRKHRAVTHRSMGHDRMFCVSPCPGWRAGSRSVRDPHVA